MKSTTLISDAKRFFDLGWGDFGFSAGRLWLLLKAKFQDGIGTAYYRDVVRARILEAPPNLHLPTDSTCEIHALTSAHDYVNLLWALRTFQMSTGKTYALAIHDDGTLTKEACRHLLTAFPAAKLISRAQSDARATQQLAAYHRCKALRDNNILSLKLFDFPAFLEANRMILLDSDILFFNRPTALLAALDDPKYVYNTLNKDWRFGYTIDPADIRHLLDFELLPLINSGLGLIHKASLRLDWIEQFLALPAIVGHPHRIEQTLIALCSSRYGFRMLPAEYDVHSGSRMKSAPCRHYAGPMRPLMYSEGIRELVADGALQG